MLSYLKKKIPDTHPLRLLVHKIKGFIAALIYWFPADNLIVVGVTGTNGKTTTTNLITNILNAADYKVGMTSTINFQIGDRRWVNDTKKTTMSPFVLQKTLREMVKSGCKYAVLEVSSHAITQSRVYGINFDVAVITNVTPEHIEYHGSFDAYLNAKGELFKKVSKGKRKFGIQKMLISNADDKYFSYFNQFVADRKMNYGLKQATVYAAQMEAGPNGTKFTLHVPNNAIPVHFSLPGEFNVYNALAAASCAISLQVPIDKVKKGLEDSRVVSGRFEHIECGQDFSVIVDYAHTPEALENLFSMYSRLSKGRLIAVFGATGGGRDKSKRPRMGEIANEFADYIIVTDDDPYEEDEWDIIEQISEGIPRKEGRNFWKIPDRREAIRLALSQAKSDDTVVIAGKGAEEVMMVRGKKVKWNDKAVVKELLEREVEIELSVDELVRVGK